MLTVDDVLAMLVLRAAAPRVLAGRAGLDRPVRWVHTSELADIGPLLREGDLLLTTGIALPDDGPGLAAVVDGLAASGAAGLVVELGRRWRELPAELADACDRHGLPLVALARETRFAAVAQAVGEQIVDRQVAELREAQRVHDTFTELSIGEAGPSEVLAAVQRLAGAAVVLESEQHQVLDYRAGPDDIAPFLADWTTRSRGVVLDGRTTWDAALGWLVTRVGRRERGWGRLVVQVAERPTERQVAMVERAAAALALHRLQDRQADGAVRRTHHELLVALLADPTAPGLLQRCEAAGLPTAARRVVGVAMRPRPAGRLEEVTGAAVHAAHELRVPALVGQVDGDVRLLLSFPAAGGRDPDAAVDALVARVASRHPLLAAAGRPAVRTGELDRTLREARQVLDSVRDDLPARRPGAGLARVHRLADVGLRGLLAMLADDERLHLYVERQLSRLRAADPDGRQGLEAALTALLEHPVSKAAAAASLHLSRPVLYDRLARVERALGIDLDDPDARVSLHVALLADRLRRGTPS